MGSSWSFFLLLFFSFFFSSKVHSPPQDVTFVKCQVRLPPPPPPRVGHASSAFGPARLHSIECFFSLHHTPDLDFSTLYFLTRTRWLTHFLTSLFFFRLPLSLLFFSPVCMCASSPVERRLFLLLFFIAVHYRSFGRALRTISFLSMTYTLSVKVVYHIILVFWFFGGGSFFPSSFFSSATRHKFKLLYRVCRSWPAKVSVWKRINQYGCVCHSFQLRLKSEELNEPVKLTLAVTASPFLWAKFQYSSVQCLKNIKIQNQPFRLKESALYF